MRLLANVIISSLLTTTPQTPVYDAFAMTYDVLDSGTLSKALGIDAMREKAGALIKGGNVLEVAVGTGLQAAYYPWEKITSFTGVDVSSSMLEQARQRIPGLAAGNNVPVTLVEADATTALGFPSQTFDTVVDTFSLCVMARPGDAVREMARVLKDDGVLVLLENTVSTNPVLAAFQDVTEPLITPLSKSCRWNVNVPKLAAEQRLVSTSMMSIQQGTIRLETFVKAR